MAAVKRNHTLKAAGRTFRPARVSHGLSLSPTGRRSRFLLLRPAGGAASSERLRESEASSKTNHRLV